MKKDQTTLQGGYVNMIPSTQETCECGKKLYWRSRQSKYCYGCDTEWELEDEGKSAVDKLKEEFYNGLQTGTQLDAIQNSSRLVADEFAYAPDFNEVEDPEFEERLAEMEAQFDEWWSKNPNSPRVKFDISTQCRNFLTAIRKHYVPVGLVKQITNSLNSRERSLVWATWKGFCHKVYYPKG